MKTLFPFTAVALIVLIIGIGCKKSDKNDYYKTDNCLNVRCYNGTLDSLSCVCNCNAGYEGDSCTIEIRERFLGSFIGYYYCNNDSVLYKTTVIKDTTSYLHLNFTVISLLDSGRYFNNSFRVMLTDTNYNYAIIVEYGISIDTEILLIPPDTLQVISNLSYAECKGKFIRQ
jgi:hypothetical protein